MTANIATKIAINIANPVLGPTLNFDYVLVVATAAEMSITIDDKTVLCWDEPDVEYILDRLATHDTSPLGDSHVIHLYPAHLLFGSARTDVQKDDLIVDIVKREQERTLSMHHIPRQVFLDAVAEATTLHAAWFASQKPPTN